MTIREGLIFEGAVLSRRTLLRRGTLSAAAVCSILADAKRCLAAGDVRRASACFSEFRDGLERHIAVEEKVLFPAFEKRAGVAATRPTHAMRSEHAEIRRLMAEVASNLARGAYGHHAKPLAALTARVYLHSLKEERILYSPPAQGVTTNGS